MSPKAARRAVQRPRPQRRPGRGQPTGSGAGARERLIQAGTAVFRELGYRAAPLDEVLARSGVAKSNLYYHFPGKLELACAAVDEWTRAVGTSPLRAALSDERCCGLERLRRFYREFEGFSSQGPCGCPFGMLAAEDDLDEPLRRRIDKVFTLMRRSLEGAVRAGQRDGSIRTDLDPEALSHSLLAVMQGGGVMGRAGRDPGRITRAAEPLLGAIAAPRPPRRRAVAR